jgi:hypothetical protein
LAGLLAGLEGCERAKASSIGTCTGVTGDRRGPMPLRLISTYDVLGLYGDDFSINVAAICSTECEE